MKKISYYSALMLCSMLFVACNYVLTEDPFDVQKNTVSVATLANAEVVNRIRVTGDFFTGSEHSITYLPDTSGKEYTIIISGTLDNYSKTSSNPYKAAFFKSGTYTVSVGIQEGRSGGPGGRNTSSYNKIIAEREITIYGDDLVRFYQYQYVQSPYDYWITPTLYGLNYDNGKRKLVGAYTNPRTGETMVGYDATQFYAVLEPTERYDQYPYPYLLTGISERRWTRPKSNIPGPGYHPYSYSTSNTYGETDIKGSLVADKFWIYRVQKPGTVPLYSIRKQWISNQGSYGYVINSDIYHLSTANEVTTSTVTIEGPGYYEKTFPGTIVGYVFSVPPALNRRPE